MGRPKGALASCPPINKTPMWDGFTIPISKYTQHHSALLALPYVCQKWHSALAKHGNVFLDLMTVGKAFKDAASLIETIIGKNVTMRTHLVWWHGITYCPLMTGQSLAKLVNANRSKVSKMRRRAKCKRLHDVIQIINWQLSFLICHQIAYLRHS